MCDLVAIKQATHPNYQLMQFAIFSPQKSLFYFSNNKDQTIYADLIMLVYEGFCEVEVLNLKTSVV